MQLLEITVTPMKYELEIEHSRLEMKQDFTPRADVQTTPGKFDIQTEPAKLHLDTYEARKSLGLLKIEDIVRAAADKGNTSIKQYTQNTAAMGVQMAKIEDGVTIGEIIRQKMLEQPSSYTTFLPSGGVEISCDPSQIKMDYQEGSVNYDWQIKSNSMSYVPGNVRMRILQYASVNIKYLGSPMYIPPSSDPNYEEPPDK